MKHVNKIPVHIIKCLMIQCNAKEVVVLHIDILSMKLMVIIYALINIIAKVYQIIMMNNIIVVIVIVINVFYNVNINIIIMMDQNIDVLQIIIVIMELLVVIMPNVLIQMNVLNKAIYLKMQYILIHLM